MGNIIIIELTSRALKDLQKIRGFNDMLYGVPKSKEIINTIEFDEDEHKPNIQEINDIINRAFDNLN